MVVISNTPRVLRGITGELKIPYLQCLQIDLVLVEFSILKRLPQVMPRLNKLFMHSTAYSLNAQPPPVSHPFVQTLMWGYACQMLSLVLPKLNTLFLYTSWNQTPEIFHHVNSSYPCLRHLIFKTERPIAKKALTILTRIEHLVFLYARTRAWEQKVDTILLRTVKKQNTYNFVRYNKKDILVGKWLPSLQQKRLLQNNALRWPSCTL